MSPSLLFNCPIWRAGRERRQWWLRPAHMTQHYCLFSMATLLSCKGISYHDLLPHVPSYCLPPVNSRPCPGIVLQSLWSSSQHARELVSLSRVCRATARIVCVVLIPFSLSQVSFCTLQQLQMLLHCPQQFPWCGDWPLSQISHPLGGGPFVHAPLFPLLPSSYWVLCGSMHPFQNYNFEFYI